MTKEELELRKQSILNAIQAIESGAQEYEMPDRTKVKKANLKDLYAELREINKALMYASNTYNTRAYVRYGSS